MHLSWRAAQDAAFLAQSRVTEVTVAYSIPIPLELLTTGLRIWVKLRGSGNVGLSSDDYLMVWATVSPHYIVQPRGLCETSKSDRPWHDDHSLLEPQCASVDLSTVLRSLLPTMARCRQLIDMSNHRPPLRIWTSQSGSFG